MRWWRRRWVKNSGPFLTVADDATRDAVDAFFAEHIADPTRLPLSADFRRGRPGADDFVIAAEEDGKILAAAFSGPPWMEAENALAYGGSEAIANALIDGSWMLHDMAVHPSVRRVGVGQALVAQVLRHAYGLGRDVVWGVASGGPGVFDFYRSTPMEVVDEGLVLQFRATADRTAGIALPIVGDEARWIARPLARRPRVIECRAAAMDLEQ